MQFIKYAWFHKPIAFLNSLLLLIPNAPASLKLTTSKQSLQGILEFLFHLLDGMSLFKIGCQLYKSYCIALLA